MSSAFRAIVSGRVQLVMFRDFIQRKASGMQLNGYVKNLPDGTVEIIAEGERATLEKIIEFARKGPLLARVDEVRVEWTEPAGRYEGFVIAYT